jgi:hypothetical protein
VMKKKDRIEIMSFEIFVAVVRYHRARMLVGNGPFSGQSDIRNSETSSVNVIKQMRKYISCGILFLNRSRIIRL